MLPFGSTAPRLAGGAAAILLLAAFPLAAQTFVRIQGTGPHVDDAQKSLSAAWGDYDGDGDPDLYSANLGLASLFRNDGAGVFVATAGPPADSTQDAAYTMSVWGDYDNDGDLDLYRVAFAIDSLFNPTDPLPNQLFRNDGGAFSPVPTSDDSTYCPAASWVDTDNDGDLDLFAAGAAGMTDLYYRNDGGTFTRRTSLPFLNSVGTGALQSWVDYDGDGDADLYMVNHGAPNELWRNLLVETGAPESFVPDSLSGLTDDTTEIDFGISWADYDNDGDLDGFMATAGADRLFRNEGGGQFVRVLGIPLVQQTMSSSCGSWGDYDNDGDVDLFVPHAGSSVLAPDLWRNDGDGAFVPAAAADVGAVLNTMPSPQCSEWADIDSDGDLDLYVNCLQNFLGVARVNRLYRNDGGANHHLQLRLVGSASNRSAVGAVVRVRATIAGAAVWQMREIAAGPTSFEFQRELRAHFGLGDATVADSLVIQWPSGILQTLVSVPADQDLEVHEPVAVGTGPFSPGPGGLRIDVAPNPFSEAATVHFGLARPGPLDLAVFDIAGRRVRTLVRGEAAAGPRTVLWDGRDASGGPLPPGVYLVRLQAGADLGVRKVLRVN